MENSSYSPSTVSDSIGSDIDEGCSHRVSSDDFYACGSSFYLQNDLEVYTCRSRFQGVLERELKHH